jgi:hypothetical protein
VHALVACCYMFASALPGARLATPSVEVQQDSMAAARKDSARRSLTTLSRPVPALGTVESAVSISYSIMQGATEPLQPREDVISSTIIGSDPLLAVVQTRDTTTRSQRPRAIEYSDAYHTRLKIHQIGAYVMLPLFISEYFVGQKLLNSSTRPNGLRTAHSFLAGSIGVVFATNTVTGAWNFWDARQDPKGRARREIHSVLMLASDAGVLLTAISGSDANHSLSNARTHRTIAISSIALSAVGTGMMWLWRDR